MDKKNFPYKKTALIVAFLIFTSMFPTRKKNRGTKKLSMDDSVSIVTYNIGDCTFGEIDFSTSQVEAKENLNEIIFLLEERSYDICLLQESDWINISNYLINPSKKIATHFKEHSFIYGTNSNLFKMFDSGNMTLTKYDSTNKCLKIPVKGKGLINDKFYVHKLLIESRIKIDGTDKELVVFNIHLAPMAKNRSVKLKQIKYILELAKLEYERGNYVVIGGDWNTDLSFKDQVHPILSEFEEIFNDEIWEFKKHEGTTHQFINKDGKEKNQIIDGFLFSPNINGYVNILEEYKYSDHNPVELKLKLKRK